MPSIESRLKERNLVIGAIIIVAPIAQIYTITHPDSYSLQLKFLHIIANKYQVPIIKFTPSVHKSVDYVNMATNHDRLINIKERRSMKECVMIIGEKNIKIPLNDRRIVIL